MFRVYGTLQPAQQASYMVAFAQVHYRFFPSVAAFLEPVYLNPPVTQGRRAGSVVLVLLAIHPEVPVQRIPSSGFISKERARRLIIHSLFNEGDPAKVITNLIKEMNIDLLIMRAHAHEESKLEHLEERLENLVFGRSHEKIIRKMPCAILLVKD